MDPTTGQRHSLESNRLLAVDGLFGMSCDDKHIALQI